MSKIEQLIQELCPGGVPIVTVADVCQIKNGKDYKHLEKGNFPVWGTGGIMTYVNEFAYDKPSVLLPRKGSIENVYFTDEPFWTVDTLFYTIINEEIITPKYLYIFFTSINLKTYNTSVGNRPSLTQTVLNAIEIPLPPLPIQEEIVRILDTFTEAQANLEQELELRKKQYEYYRNQLLTFDENDPSVKWMKLQEVAEIGTGSSNTNEGLQDGLYPFYTRGQEVLRKNTFEYDETAVITAGDGVGVGKVMHFVKGKYALHQRAYRIHTNEEVLLAKFFFYYMKKTFYDYIMQNSVFSSVNSIRKPKLLAYPIPVATISRQQEIVSILDKFESAIQTLEEELALRKKQYEYYREKLLTFN